MSLKNSIDKLFIMLFCLYCAKAGAQNMYFYLNDGTVHSYPIEGIARMQFNSDNINLIMSDDAVVSYELSALNFYRYFPESVTLLPEIEQPKLILYPNPVETNLKLNYFFPNEGKGINMQIIDRIGTIIFEKHLDASEKTIDVEVSDLSAGHYYCTIGSGKFMLSKAFIKQ